MNNRVNKFLVFVTKRWKWLYRYLNDKNDYHLDPILKNEIEISEEIMSKALYYQKYIILKKIRYFWRYDKLFFMRLFVRISAYITISIIILTVFSIFLYYTFGIDLKVKATEVVKPHRSVQIILPDTVNIDYYRNELTKRNISIVVYHIPDSEKNWTTFKKRISDHESANSGLYTAQNGIYWGKYQMDGKARILSGLSPNITWEEYSTNPDLQEGSFKAWIRYLKRLLGPEIKKFNGKVLNGQHITESGLIAMCHATGIGPVKEFLYENKIPGETALYFLNIGGYDLSEIK